MLWYAIGEKTISLFRRGGYVSFSKRKSFGCQILWEKMFWLPNFMGKNLMDMKDAKNKYS